MGLQEEIPAPLHCYAAIHDCTIWRIAFDSAVHIGVFILGGVETRMVSLSNDYNVDLRTIGSVLLIEFFASWEYLLVKLFF